MAIEINLEKHGHKKKTFLGFSYTTFFLNFLVPLFRGDAKRFIKKWNWNRNSTTSNR